MVPKLSMQLRFTISQWTATCRSGCASWPRASCTADCQRRRNSTKACQPSSGDVTRPGPLLRADGEEEVLAALVALRGQATASPAEVSTSGIHIEVPGAGIDVKGKVEFAKHLLALGLRVGSTNLPRLLASLGVQPLATRGVRGGGPDRHYGAAARQWPL